MPELAEVVWKCSFLGCDKDAVFLAGDSAAHVQTVCAEGAGCFDRKVPIDPTEPNLPTFNTSRRLKVEWADDAIDQALGALIKFRDSRNVLNLIEQDVMVAIDCMRAIVKENAS